MNSQVWKVTRSYTIYDRIFLHSIYLTLCYVVFSINVFHKLNHKNNIYIYKNK